LKICLKNVQTRNGVNTLDHFCNTQYLSAE